MCEANEVDGVILSCQCLYPYLREESQGGGLASDGVSLPFLLPFPLPLPFPFPFSFPLPLGGAPMGGGKSASLIEKQGRRRAGGGAAA